MGEAVKLCLSFTTGDVSWQTRSKEKNNPPHRRWAGSLKGTWQTRSNWAITFQRGGKQELVIGLSQIIVAETHHFNHECNGLFIFFKKITICWWAVCEQNMWEHGLSCVICCELFAQLSPKIFWSLLSSSGPLVWGSVATSRQPLSL